MELTSEEFITTERMRSICARALYCDRNLCSSTIDRRSKAVFGIAPKVCVFLWLHLEGLLPVGAKPKHLLWALSFLKLYEVEEGRASRLQVDEKTCRKWTKILLLAISQLQLVSNIEYIVCNLANVYLQIQWSDRLRDTPIDDCFCSVDGTDCPVNEPTPYSSGWYSHKINAAGLRYEIAVSIERAKIVSVRCASHYATLHRKYAEHSLFRLPLLAILCSDFKV